MMLISTDVGSPSGLKGSSSISLSPKGERREFHLCEASYNRAFYKLPLRVGRGYRDSWDRDLIDFYKILAVARMERKVRGISFFSLDYRRRMLFSSLFFFSIKLSYQAPGRIDDM